MWHCPVYCSAIFIWSRSNLYPHKLTTFSEIKWEPRLRIWTMVQKTNSSLSTSSSTGLVSAPSFPGTCSSRWDKNWGNVCLWKIIYLQVVAYWNCKFHTVEEQLSAALECGSEGGPPNDLQKAWGGYLAVARYIFFPVMTHWNILIGLSWLHLHQHGS